jgi:hypothetical protein
MRALANTFYGEKKGPSLCIFDCSVPHPAYGNLAGIKLKPGVQNISIFH